MRRVEIETRLLEHRTWILETYCSLSDQVLNQPVTQDQHDPAEWWTVKDHFAHCVSLQTEGIRLVRRTLGEDVAPFEFEVEWVPDRPVEQVMAGVNKMTHVWYVENRGKSMEEIVREGERVLAEQLSLLASVPEERLDSVVPNVPQVYDSVAKVLLSACLHDPVHWTWVLDGMARLASQGADVPRGR